MAVTVTRTSKLVQDVNGKQYPYIELGMSFIDGTETFSAVDIMRHPRGPWAGAPLGRHRGTVYALSVDNTGNAAEAQYLALYNAVNPTLGTTAPDCLFLIPAATQVFLYLNMPNGIPFPTGLSIACATNKITFAAGPTVAVPVILYAR
jgi:hypothetical protein